MLKEHEELEERITSVKEELSILNAAQQDVSRKEHQIRASLAAEKLKSAGYGELLENADLQKLVTLDALNLPKLGSSSK